MKNFIIILIFPFISLNAQDLLKDLKLPTGKKVQKLEKKLLKKTTSNRQSKVHK